MLYLSQLLPIEELSQLLNQRRIGLELIDFSVGMNLDRMDEYVKKWQDALELLHHPPITIHGPFLDLNPMSFEPLTAQASWTRFAQAYEAAQLLKADRVIYHTCRVPRVCYLEGWAERLSDFWNRFLDCRKEIPVSVENVFDEDPLALADLASRVTADNFSLCLDIGHANHASAFPAEQWLEILSPWIAHLHLHDNHGLWDEHLAMGAGSIPWDNMGKKIASLPRLESVTIENTSARDFEISLAFLSEKMPDLFPEE